MNGIDLNEFAWDVHENAKAHGFWEGERDDAEVIALIHSEWSEALEAYRNNDPMVWHKAMIKVGSCDSDNCNHCNEPGCSDPVERKEDKPEGVAVELIDGCIRILDACAAWGISIPDDPHISDELIEYIDNWKLPTLIVNLHERTSVLWAERQGRGNTAAFIIAAVFRWLQHREIDPEALMLEKHEYNKTRPYKHGKKF